MKILFSYPGELKNEIELINHILSEEGWDKFHLRKPNWSEKKTMELFNSLNKEVKQKTVIHQKFKGSCHSFAEVEKVDEILEYCFLSPVFDSISKEGYKANFDKKELKAFLQKERKVKVIGLGGVTDANFSELTELGFDGGAFLGSVWKKYE